LPSSFTLLGSGIHLRIVEKLQKLLSDYVIIRDIKVEKELVFKHMYVISHTLIRWWDR